MGWGRLAALVWTAGALTAAVCLEPTSASAGDAPIPIRVTKGPGAGGCPDSVTLTELTNASMHRVVLEANDSAAKDDVRIVVEFTHGPPGFSAAIRVVGGARAGVRTLDDAGAKCDDLAEAVVVTLAVMLGEGLGPPTTASGSASVASSASASSASSASTSTGAKDGERLPEPNTPRPISFDVSFGGGAMFGVVRTAAPYLSTEVELAVARRFRFGAGGFAILPQRFEFAEAPGAFAAVSLYAGQLFGCVTVLSAKSARIDGSLCALGVVGGIRGRTEGLAVNGDSTRLWLAAGALARLDGPLFGPLWWNVRAGALAVRTRETFAVQGAGTVYQPGILGYSLGLSLSATIW